MSVENIQEQQQYSKARVGIMLAAVTMLVVIFGFGNFKLIPMQSAIMEYFQIREAAYGYLNTASGWATVLCAIPFGFMVRKLRCNVSIIIGIVVAVAGIFIQTIAPTFAVLVIGRVIEGTGTGFATLVTGSLTLNLAKREQVSFWSSFMIMAGTLPQVIMAQGGTALLVNSGLSFQQIFRIIAYIYIAALVLWLVLVPFSLKITGIGNSAKPTREQTLRVIKNKNNWFIAIASLFYTLASVTFTAYIIKFLTIKGLSQHEAANIYSIMTILGLFSMVGFGILSDKLHTKRKIAIVSCFSAACILVLLATLPANMMLLYAILWGIFPRSLAGLGNASAADIAELPADIPIVNSFKNTVTHIGTIVFGILMGYLIQYMGYEFTIFMIAGGMVIAGILWILAKKIP